MKRLYWTNPDVFEIEVEVKAIADCKVAINPIIFHPDEGGQPADKGTIGGAAVCNVEIVNGQIIHTLDRPLADGKYAARLDKQHRLYTASHHTAQHVLSGIAEKQFGLKTTGVHIGSERSTVDFDKKVDWEVAEGLERRAMEVVTSDIPVETVFNDKDVRIRGDFEETESDVIRVVKIGDCDKSACCGAHLQTTGQIGVIRILSIENKKQGTRMVFLAGSKALEYSQAEASVLRDLRKTAGCSNSELAAQFERALGRANELSKEIDRLWSSLLPSLSESAQIAELESSKIGVQVAEMPKHLLAKLAALIAEAVDGAGIAVSDVNIAISSNKISAGELLGKIQSAVGGKGGGSSKAANGRLDRTVTAGEIIAILGQKTG